MTTEVVDIMELEKRVEGLEIGQQYEATKEAVRLVEEKYLLKFREIQTALEAEQQQQRGFLDTKSSSNNNPVVGSNNDEIEQLRKENKLLNEKNTKLEYRIQHIVTNMEQMYNELYSTKK